MTPVRTVALRMADLPESGVRKVVVEGIPVAVVRTGGEVFAVSDICSHAEVSLSEGELDGCTLECWLHGSRFDLRTGQPSGPPAFDPIPVYPVEIQGEGGEALVLIAVPEEA